jgi:hypothetical protein
MLMRRRWSVNAHMGSRPVHSQNIFHFITHGTVIVELFWLCVDLERFEPQFWPIMRGQIRTEKVLMPISHKISSDVINTISGWTKCDYFIAFSTLSDMWSRALTQSVEYFLMGVNRRSWNVSEVIFMSACFSSRCERDDYKWSKRIMWCGVMWCDDDHPSFRCR